MQGGIFDIVTIGLDMSGDDKTCLTVVRCDGKKLEVINQFFGRDAEDLYKKLTGLKEV